MRLSRRSILTATALLAATPLLPNLAKAAAPKLGLIFPPANRGAPEEGLAMYGSRIDYVTTGLGLETMTPEGYDAVIEGLKTVGARRIVAPTAYNDVVNARLRAFLLEHGFEVAAIQGLGVEAVEDAVHDRRGQDGNQAENDEAAIKRVERGGQLVFQRMQLAHRPHAAQDHRGVEQRVDPRHAIGVAIAHDAEKQRGGDDATGQGYRMLHPHA